ncbi:MAG: hypothetical protein EOO77_02310 [Oxalobacteraceae bacterium]|nr:MAG: hypothetical protein EOO77_02310 [Oxalobacteraceae bacterium]
MAMQAPITGAIKRALNLTAALNEIGTADCATTSPLKLSRCDRAWLGNLIDALIGVLDNADGDADREHDDLDRCLTGDDGPVQAPALDRLWRNAA